jgi:SHS family lactate transporter-like MFS transporter
MATVAETLRPITWWKEPTRDQWYAWVAAWLGWTLDAFDFTAFLLIIVPIAKEFAVPVTAVLTVTLWMRLVGATANGWLADRIGRKAPLMISIAWYSVCNFLARRPPSFFLLSCSGRSSASARVRNGLPARHWQWRPGRSARAASWVR